MKLITVFYTTLTALLFLGCQPQTKAPNVIKNTKTSSAQQVKVAKAFSNAKNLQATHSKWFNRTEKLPLTIITTAFIDNAVLKTKEYKQYISYIKQIQKDITILDKLSGKKISDIYSSVKFVDYNKNSDAKSKFNAAYNNRYSDKDKLTDMLRPDSEQPSQELLIRFNYDEFKKGNLTIEGYKTVKQANKKRNSYYYTLRKTGYSKLNKKEKKQAIANSIITALQLSIPEYVSIDRSKLVKDGEVLRFITPQVDGTYKGEIWKYEVDNEVKEIEEKKIKLLSEFHNLRITHPYRIDEGMGNIIKIDSKGIYIIDREAPMIRVLFKPHNNKMKTKILLKAEFKGKYNGVFFDGGGAITNNLKYLVTSNYVSGGGYRFDLWDIKNNKYIKKLYYSKYYQHFKISNDNLYICVGYGDDLNTCINIKTKEVLEYGKTNKIDIVKIKDTRYDKKYFKKFPVSFSEKISKNRLVTSAGRKYQYWDIRLMKKELKKNKPKSLNIYKEVRKLNAQVKNIKVLSKYRETENIQNLLTTSFKDKDMNVLVDCKYIDKSSGLTLQNINNIAKSLNYKVSSPILELLFKDIYKKYTSKFIDSIEKTIVIKKQNKYDLDTLYFSSNLDYKNSGYVLIKEIKDIDINHREPKFLKGHGATINDVVFSKDDKYALSASGDERQWSIDDNSIKYWDLKSGSLLKTLNGHNARVVFVEFLKNEKGVRSITRNGKMKNWNLVTGEELSTSHSRVPIKSKVLTPDGKYIIPDDTYKTVFIKNVETFKVIKAVELDIYHGKSRAISHNGKYMLTAGMDKILVYWNLDMLFMNGDY